MFATSKRRKCCNDPNIFCISVVVLLYHLKDVISIVLSKQFTLLVLEYRFGDQDKSCAPRQVCTTYVETLRSWSQGKNVKLKFGVPMVWREPKNHVDDCYFCLVNVKGFNKKNKQHLQYPNIHSAMRPISHSDKVPVSIFTKLPDIDEDQLRSSTSSTNSDDDDDDEEQDKERALARGMECWPSFFV